LGGPDATRWQGTKVLGGAWPLAPLAEAGQYHLVSARIDWKNILGHPVDLALFATNLFDEEYRIGQFPLWDSFGYITSYWGEPRMYGIQFRYRFGGE
jgi:iron complex outermembrane receptor protein